VQEILGLKQIIKILNFLLTPIKPMALKKLKPLQINGLLQFLVKLLRHINIPVHHLTLTPCQIQAQKLSLPLVLEARCTKSLNLERHTMEQDTQIPLQNMSPQFLWHKFKENTPRPLVAFWVLLYNKILVTWILE